MNLNADLATNAFQSLSIAMEKWIVKMGVMSQDAVGVFETIFS